jgi:predicted nucleotidyltransferase
MDRSPASIPRSQIILALDEALAAMPEVLAAYLGGSDASGRTDTWSDVDLVVVVEEGAVETAFAILHAALEELSPIVHRWRLADPTWHGNSQEFLALRDADPAHFIDLVVQVPEGGERFLEVERHGTPLVLFDRAGVLAPTSLDRVALQARIDERLAVLRERFALFQTLVTRAVRRGFVAEAAVAYQDHTYRPLIELLRIRHCPDRFDYGARYLDRDLPADLRAEVEALALPGTLDEVEAFRGRAQALFEATLAELAPAS